MSTEYKSGARRRFDSPITMPDGINVETLSGALTLNDKSADFQILDPGGSTRVVTLPAEETSEGRILWFYNAADAAENLTVQTDAAGAVATVGPSTLLCVACKGTTWNIALATSADFGTLGISTDLIAESTAAAGVTVDGLLIKDGAIARGGVPVGAFTQSIVTGGSAGDLTLTGVATGDTLIGVIEIDGAGSDVTDVVDLTSEFSITGADTINNTGGTDTTGSKLLVTWFDAVA